MSVIFLSIFNLLSYSFVFVTIVIYIDKFFFHDSFYGILPVRRLSCKTLKKLIPFSHELKLVNTVFWATGLCTTSNIARLYSGFSCMGIGRDWLRDMLTFINLIY